MTATLDIDGEVFDVTVTLTDGQVDDCDDLIRELGFDGAIAELKIGMEQAALTLTALWRMNTDEWREAQKNGWQTEIMDRALQVAHEEIGVYIAQTAHVQGRAGGGPHVSHRAVIEQGPHLGGKW
jgi:hypothetical protein